ncbi:hypothetical protein SODALDRAFT_335303 [Sodiomyces alkalinus F11]|uniref:Secreted protein n=1 Tax=Sodiomyces alkalinus (strain CBS 110278 / VKM F-3762 / F11) TaxID=1314773 RepID=A0A3N2PNY1_SODAK|nr:hypothetical protein SODALDRAFT_335303 [Sodiomyces alkalinus F11]ROT36228.1 hypothetical protein SODALDRAFT_335303 [Sodiomyces alkalinus F11]
MSYLAPGLLGCFYFLVTSLLVARHPVTNTRHQQCGHTAWGKGWATPARPFELSACVWGTGKHFLWERGEGN